MIQSQKIKYLCLLQFLFTLISFSIPASALDGKLYGWLRTFDSRNYYCDDTIYNCGTASKLQSRYNKLPANLPLEDVKVRVMGGAPNVGAIGNICNSVIFTGENGHFECHYDNVPANTVVTIHVDWEDKDGRFRLRKYNNSTLTNWTTVYPTSNLGPGSFIRLNGGSQGANPSDDNWITFYEDSFSLDDIRAATLYADTWLALEKIQEGGAKKFFDPIYDEGYLNVVLDIEGSVNGEALGSCCYRQNLSTPTTLEQTVEINTVLINPVIFGPNETTNSYPLKTSTVIHEIGHLLHYRAEIYYHDYAYSQFYRSQNVCLSAPNNTLDWNMFSEVYGGCYQPTEALAEFFRSAVTYGNNSGAQAARLEINTDFSLELYNGCFGSASSDVYSGIRYFWDLYDISNDNQSHWNCQAETLSLSLADVFKHAVFGSNPNDSDEGTLQRLLDEHENGAIADCGPSKSHVNDCISINEAGIYDMSRLAFDLTLDQDYIDIWQNNRRSPGDYKWQFYNVNNFCSNQCTPATAPSGNLGGVADWAAQCTNECLEALADKP